MSPALRKKIGMLLLFAMLATAFLLRIQQWAHFSVPDENTNVETILPLHENPFPASWQPYPGYPPFFFYLNFVLSWVYLKLLLFLGIIGFRSEFVHSGQELTLKMGQFLSAVWGTALVYAVFRIGRDFFNERTAWAASLLTAANPFMVLNSHIFKPDILLALMMLTSLFFALTFLETRKTAPFFWTSLFLGLAIVTKYNSAVELLLPAALLLLSRRELGWKTIGTRILPAGIGGLAAGIAIGAPNWIVHPVSGVREAISFIFYYFDKTTFYDPGTPAYLRFAADCVRSFGWPLFAVFVLGFFYSLARRKKTDLLIIVYMAVYYLVLGRSTFYSNRFALPLLGAMAIFIAKTLFLDLDALLTRFPRLRRGVSFSGFTAVLVFSFATAGGNLKTYHLLSTAGPWEQAENYRKRHIPDIFPTASESFTPHRLTDLGNWDLTRIPLDRFQGEKAVDFVITGLLSDFILNAAQNQKVKTELVRRLAGYRPFFKASRPRFGPWDGDITFWYRAAGEFRKSTPPRADMSLPRSFLPPANAQLTANLPLQTYEKNPFFGKTENGLYCQTIYSTRRIEKIKFVFLFPEGPSDLVLLLNGKRQEMKKDKSGGIRLLEATGLKPRKLYFDYVYRLELIETEKEIPCSFVFTPVTGSSPPARPRSPDSRWTAAGEIPELFSNAPTPPWVAFFSRRTGIDLSLLTFVNRMEVWRNDAGATADSRTDWFPLEKGRYSLLLSLEPIVPGEPVTDGCSLKWKSVSATGGESETASAIPPMGNKRRLAIPVTVNDPLEFFRISVEHLRASNLLLRSMVIQPDYREWLLDEERPASPAGTR